MEFQAPHPDWVLQPLLDAGLATERIRTLVDRLGFEVITREGSPTEADLRTVVADQPPAVRSAWVEVLSRLIV
ncbi:hypothetical protein [Geodermatophilus sp. SYSU D01105]